MDKYIPKGRVALSFLNTEEEKQKAINSLSDKIILANFNATKLEDKVNDISRSVFYSDYGNVFEVKHRSRPESIKFVTDWDNNWVEFSDMVIKKVADPVDAQDVATKAYVDANAGGSGSYVEANDDGQSGFTVNKPTDYAGGGSQGYALKVSGQKFIVTTTADFTSNLNLTSNFNQTSGNFTFNNANGNVNLLASGGNLDVNMQNVYFNNTILQNVADPVSAQDAATKAYVDANAGSGGSSANFLSPFHIGQFECMAIDGNPTNFTGTEQFVVDSAGGGISELYIKGSGIEFQIASNAFTNQNANLSFVFIKDGETIATNYRQLEGAANGYSSTTGLTVSNTNGASSGGFLDLEAGVTYNVYLLQLGGTLIN